MTLKDIILSTKDIEDGLYKEKSKFGGGTVEWDIRGQAQFAFLLDMGIQRHSRVLDIGCGPLRAGVHLIRWLNEGCYTGYDYNKSFVEAARQEIKVHSLESKKPTVHTITDFDCSGLGQFDFILVFSILQRYDLDVLDDFFEKTYKACIPSTLLYISHCNRQLETHGFKISRIFNTHDAFSEGWKTDKQKPFPICEYKMI
jgi:SAM-dependent methyltransferase